MISFSTVSKINYLMDRWYAVKPFEKNNNLMTVNIAPQRKSKRAALILVPSYRQ